MNQPARGSLLGLEGLSTKEISSILKDARKMQRGKTKPVLRAPILAIIPKGKNAWTVLLRSKNLGPDGLGPPTAQAPTLRLVALPREVAPPEPQALVDSCSTLP